jgi:hypothetical protein
MELHQVKFEDHLTISTLVNDKEPKQMVRIRWGEGYDRIIVSYRAPEMDEIDVRTFMVPHDLSEEALFAMFEEIIMWVHSNFFVDKKGAMN